MRVVVVDWRKWNCVALGVLAGIADDAGRHADDESVVGDVARHDRAGPDRALLAERTPATSVAFEPIEAPRSTSVGTNSQSPLALQAAIGVGRPRKEVVGEHHAVADEDFVLERHAFADEGVRRDLAGAPIAAFFWISTNGPTRLPLPIVRL